MGKYHVLQCSILAFPLAASYNFTKLLRPLLCYWKAQGLKIVVYLDDGLCAMAGHALLVKASELVHHSLDGTGFMTHPTKCIWEPTQNLVWLGFFIDLFKDQIDVPQGKISSLLK